MTATKFDELLAQGTEIVSTDQLAEGDLVLHYGMVIRLGERKTYQGFAQRTIYHFPGAVQNMDEVHHRGHVTWGLLQADGQWSVQGNALATWTRVVPSS